MDFTDVGCLRRKEELTCVKKRSRPAPAVKKKKADGRTLFVRIVAFAVALLMIGSVVLAALMM